MWTCFPFSWVNLKLLVSTKIPAIIEKEERATGEECRNSYRRNEKAKKVETMPSCGCVWWWKWSPMLKEQYRIGTRGIFRETSYQFRDLNVQCTKQKVETEASIYVLIPWKWVKPLGVWQKTQKQRRKWFIKACIKIDIKKHNIYFCHDCLSETHSPLRVTWDYLSPQFVDA